MRKNFSSACRSIRRTFGRYPARAIFVSIALTLNSEAQAEQLDVPVVLQQTPVWCWAATSEMVLRYYGAQTINPGGNYQCGVVATAAPACWSNCGACVSSVGHAMNLVTVLARYAYAHQQITGSGIEDFNPAWRSYLSAGQIENAIDSGYPVLAGISPTYAAAPDGWGLSQHVVVIAGYEDFGGDTMLTVNDPYPYSPFEDPYLAAGATKLQTGQYRIRYATFRSQLRYQNSITFD